MDLDEFLQLLNKLKENLSPHQGAIPKIMFYCEDEESIEQLKIKDIVPDVRPGCLCWDGIDVVLELKIG